MDLPHYDLLGLGRRTHWRGPNSGEFYTARFLLGVAEAGFFPGVTIYLTHWCPAAQRGKAFAGFIAGNAIAQAIGAPVSAIIAGYLMLLLKPISPPSIQNAQ